MLRDGATESINVMQEDASTALNDRGGSGETEADYN